MTLQITLAFVERSDKLPISKMKAFDFVFTKNLDGRVTSIKDRLDLFPEQFLPYRDFNNALPVIKDRINAYYLNDGQEAPIFRMVD